MSIFSLTLTFLGFGFFLFEPSLSCQVVEVTSSATELSYLNGARFKLNPTLLADGRPVYEEIRNDDEPPRLIHHYSHDGSGPNGDSSNVDYSNIEFYGRWIIGGSLYNGDGWAFISSWSIEPSHEMMESYSNADIILNDELAKTTQDDAQRSTLNLKDKWSVFLGNEWRRAGYDELTVRCDNSTYTDLTDWLFITFRNDTTVSWFRMNITNDFNLNIHGFYYRVAENYYRKVDSNIFVENLNGNYRIFAYYGYTDASGIPLFSDVSESETAGIIDPIQLVATDDASGGNDNSFPATWNLVRNTSQSESKDDSTDVETVLEGVSVEILTRRDEDETIFDVMRDYYNNKKRTSFKQSIRSTLEKSGLISEGESGGMFSKYLGGGSSNSNKELSEDEKKIVNDVERKMLIRLNNGMIFSLIGFGTGGLGGFEANRRLIQNAIEIGYRVIDSASAYDSETAIGDFIYSLQNNESSILTRDDLFITSKVWPTNLGFIETQTDFYESLDKINSNYMDLYMIHWPRCMDHFSWMDCSQASGKSYLQSYQLMEKMYAEGRILSLGVSNWDFNLWEQLSQANGCQIIPQVVQNYFDIQHQDWELLKYFDSWGVIFQGYATYRGVAQADVRSESEPHYLEWRETLNNIGKAKSEENDDLTITGAQILLKWLIDANVAVIPRSHNIEHIKDNWNLWRFDLTKDEYSLLTTKSWDEVRKRLKQEL